MKITFRYGEKKDIPKILEFIKKLGVHEKASHMIWSTEELLEEWLFEKQYGEALLVLVDDKEAGVSIFNKGFSAYVGTGILFIDTLFVEEEYRGKGVGKAIIQKMAEITLERGCERLEWICLNDNHPAYEIYEYMGAVPLTSCTTFRTTGDALRKMIEN